MLGTLSRVFAHLFIFFIFSSAEITFAQLPSLNEVKTRWTMRNEQYYVVKEPMTAQVIIGNKRTPITFKTGQIVNLAKDSNGNSFLISYTRKNGQWAKGRVTVTGSELREHFSEARAVGGNNGLRAAPTTYKFLGKGIKIATSPAAVGDLGPGGYDFFKGDAYTAAEGTETYITETRLINYGTDNVPKWYIAHQACYYTSAEGNRCGWVRGDQVALDGKKEAPTSSVAYVPPPKRQVQKRKPSQRTAGGVVGPGCFHEDGVSELARHSNAIVKYLSTMPTPEAQAREELMDHIGSCAYTPPSKSIAALRKEKIDRLDASDTNLYDGVAFDHANMEYNRLSPPQGTVAKNVFVRENGQKRPMKKSDFIKMDAFARTIYAESRNCASKPGHLEATARIIMNRSEADNPGEFEKGSAKLTDHLYRAIVSDNAFSVWNNNNEVTGGRTGKAKDETINNHVANTMETLCPTFNPKDADIKAWGQSVEVAMFAILNPDAFKRDTRDFAAIKFYTSKAAAYKPGSGFIRRNGVKYKGSPLDPENCMVFFDADPAAYKRKK